MHERPHRRRSGSGVVALEASEVSLNSRGEPACLLTSGGLSIAGGEALRGADAGGGRKA
jgi:hypothetical protein